MAGRFRVVLFTTYISSSNQSFGNSHLRFRPSVRGIKDALNAAFSLRRTDFPCFLHCFLRLIIMGFRRLAIFVAAAACQLVHAVAVKRSVTCPTGQTTANEACCGEAFLTRSHVAGVCADVPFSTLPCCRSDPVRALRQWRMWRRGLSLCTSSIKPYLTYHRLGTFCPSFVLPRRDWLFQERLVLSFILVITSLRVS